MAMKIGSKYKFDDVCPRHWEEVAEAAGFKKGFVSEQLKQIAKKLPSVAAETKEKIANEGVDAPILNDIIAIIKTSCDRTLRLLES